MHIICAIQESVFSLQIKDFLFFTYDSFSPSFFLSGASMWAHTQLTSWVFFFFNELFPTTTSPLPLFVKSQENNTCFHKSQESLLSWTGKALLKQEFFPESWRHLRSRQVSGDPYQNARAGSTSSFPEESVCESGDMEGSYSKGMLTNIELENASLLSLVFNIPYETNSCLMNVISC